MTRVISLLQPSPETVALFDEIILLGEGKVLYAGPVGEVESYFGSLGYRAPDEMDSADFLQVLATPDGAKLYDSTCDTNAKNRQEATPYSVAELAEVFRGSSKHQEILNSQQVPWKVSWSKQKQEKVEKSNLRIKTRYANSFPKQAWLNFKRFMLLWRRDTRFLIANTIKNVIMGCSVGGVFFQTDNVASIYGV